MSRDVFAACVVVAFVLLLCLPGSLKHFVLVVAVAFLSLLILNVIGNAVNKEVRRDVAAGQASVLSGVVEGRIVSHIELLECHSVRIRTMDGVSEVFSISEAVYDVLQVNDAVEATCLPVSRTLLSLRTRRVYWRLGDPNGADLT